MCSSFVTTELVASLGFKNQHVCAGSWRRVERTRGCTRRNLCFHVENCQHAHQKQLTRRQTFDLDIESTHDQAASCRARPLNADDGLEDIRWTRGLGGERLPAASYALLPNPKKVIFFAIGQRSRMVLYQTPGRCPPHITGRVVNTVPRGWVGDPNERAPFRFHDAVDGVVHRCLSRTRNLASLNQTFGCFFLQADLNPRSGQDFFLFFSFFCQLETFFCEHLCS